MGLIKWTFGLLFLSSIAGAQSYFIGNSTRNPVNVNCVSGCSGTSSSGSGVTNIISTNTLAVSGTFTLPAGSSLTNSTFTVVGTTVGIVLGAGTNFPVQVNGSTIAISAIQGAVTVNTHAITGNVGLLGGTASLGVINVVSTNTLTVGGTLAATQSAGWNVGLTAGATLASSTMTITGSTLAVSSIQGALPAGSNSLGNVNINSTSTLTTTSSQSGLWNVGLVAGQSLTNSTFTLVSTTITISAIQAALPAGLNSLGNVNINSTSTLVTSIVASTISVVGMNGGNIPAVVNVSTVGVVPMTLTKGTQGSVGFTIQELKDAGRIPMIWSVAASTVGATTVDSGLTLTKSSGTASTFTCKTCQITSGKTLRIQAIQMSSLGNAVATAQSTTFKIRTVTSGNCLSGISTPLALTVRTATPATASAWDRYSLPIPDGYELPSTIIAFCVDVNSTFTANAPTADITIIGYEY